MTIKLSVSVMAHAKRAHLVPELAERLGIAEEQVVWDRHNNRWDTGRRAWEAHDPTATHHLVVQDDAVVCRDLRAGLERGLAHVPAEAIVSPYVGTRRPMVQKVINATRAATEARASWIVMRGLNWGVGILAPVPVIADMLPWCDQQTYPNYDRRVGRYFLEVLRWPTWCTWPSLVDHRTVPSLCGHGGGRQAHHFLGEDASALGVDWASGSVIMSQPAPLGRDPRSVARGRTASVVLTTEQGGEARDQASLIRGNQWLHMRRLQRRRQQLAQAPQRDHTHEPD